jgi:hypothetical protein
MAVDFLLWSLLFDFCYATTVSNRYDRLGQRFGYFFGRRDGGIEEDFGYLVEMSFNICQNPDRLPS